MTDTRYGLGRLHVEDARDANYPFSMHLRTINLENLPSYKYWTAGALKLNQLYTPSCVGQTGANWLQATPIRTKISPNLGFELYAECKKIDGIPDIEGTWDRVLMQVLVKRNVVERYLWAQSPKELSDWVLSTGSVMVGTNWYECVVPGTKVLTKELKWVNVENLDVGTSIVGFDDSPSRSSRYRQSTIISSTRIVRPSFEIITDKGSIAVSSSHRFIKTNTRNENGEWTSKVGRKWIHASDIREGDGLCFLTKPWITDDSREAGYLAGFYDGEGSLSPNTTLTGKRGSSLLTASQLPGITADHVFRLLKNRGFDFNIKINKATGVLQWYLIGEHAKLKFLGSIRPIRLLDQSEKAWENHAIQSEAATVMEVRDIGAQEVVAVGTSTGTLITDGFLSHNSMYEPDSKGLIPNLSGEITGGHEYLVRGYNSKTKLYTCINSWGPEWGLKGEFKLRKQDLDRLIFEEQGDACTAIQK